MKRMILILMMSPFLSKAQDSLKTFCYGCNVKEAEVMVNNISNITGYGLLLKKQNSQYAEYYLKKGNDSLKITFDGGGTRTIYYLEEVGCSNRQDLFQVYTKIFGRNSALMDSRIVDTTGNLKSPRIGEIWKEPYPKWKKYTVYVFFMHGNMDDGYNDTISFRVQ